MKQKWPTDAPAVSRMALPIESETLPQKGALLFKVIAELKDFVLRTEPGTLRYAWRIDRWGRPLG